jgi:hypothetical protein
MLLEYLIQYNKSDNISSKEQVIFEKMLIDNDFMEYRSKMDDRKERLLRIYMEYDKMQDFYT